MGFIIFMFRFRFVYNATSRSEGCRCRIRTKKKKSFSRRRHLHFNQRIAVKFPKSSFISMNSSLDDPSVAQLNNFQMGWKQTSDSVEGNARFESSFALLDRRALIPSPRCAMLDGGKIIEKLLQRGEKLNLSKKEATTDDQASFN
jgi:hypothetical protein